jgi:hypothetical protein
MPTVFFFTSLILQHGTLNPKPCAAVFCSSLVPIVSFLAFWYLDDDFFLLLQLSMLYTSVVNCEGP